MGKLIKGITIVATFAFLFYFHQKAYESAVSNVVYIVTLKTNAIGHTIKIGVKC